MNVEPGHAHVWIRGTCRETKGIFGYPIFVSYYSSRASGPLVRFGTSERMMIYKQSQNAELARNIFLKLAHWETDLSKKPQQVRLELELAEWIDGGFVGPLPETDH